MAKWIWIFVGGMSLAAQAAPCPTTPAQWRGWAESAVRSLKADEYSGKVAKRLRDEWRRCTHSHPAPVCLDPLTAFVSAHGRHYDAGASLGTKVSDRTYYEAVPFKDMMELPAPLDGAQFLRWMDGGPVEWDLALKAIEKHNSTLPEEKRLRAFLYQSQHLGPPDSSGALGRFFVYIPHEHYEQYLQFALPHPIDNPPAQFKTIRGLSVVTVQTKDKDGNPLAPPRAWFKDFWRLRDGEGNVTVSTRLEEVGRMENCTECHKTALLPITPDPRTFDSKRFSAELAWVNQQMNQRGNAHPWGYTPEAYGPHLGPRTSPQRSDSWMQRCASGLDATSRKRVMLRMRCASCHNGSQRGELTFPSGLRTQPQTRQDLVHHYVVTHETMPKGAKLTPAERRALVACLKREFYGAPGEEGLFPAHLRNEACWKSQE